MKVLSTPSDSRQEHILYIDTTAHPRRGSSDVPYVRGTLIHFYGIVKSSVAVRGKTTHSNSLSNISSVFWWRLLPNYVPETG